MVFVCELAGWVGAAVLLLGYGLFSTGRLPGPRPYHWMNLFGAAGIVASAAVRESYPSVALNVAWAAISVVALGRSSGMRLSDRREEVGQT